jgi:hypothetical protein
MKKLPSKPLVLVKWLDASALAPTTTVDDDNLEELLHKNWPIYTVGWLLKEDGHGVSIGSEWIEDEQVYRNTTFVPSSLVVSIHRLNRAKKLYTPPSTSFDDGLTSAPVV